MELRVEEGFISYLAAHKANACKYLYLLEHYLHVNIYIYIYIYIQYILSVCERK